MAEPISIGEFARRCGLAVSTLRFYDECGLLTPHRVDPSTGYRSYRQDQLAVARLIRDLRALGMPLATVRRVLDASTSERHAAVDDEIASATARLEQVRLSAAEVHRYIDEMESEMQMVVSGKALREAVKATAPMASSDPGRPLLGGLLVEARDGSLRVVATDGYRLGLRDIPAQSAEHTAFRGVTSARDLLEWAAGAPDADVAVEVADGRLVLKGQERFELALIEGQYPDYEYFLSVREDSFPAILPAGLLAAAVEENPDDAIQLSFGRSGLKVDGSTPKQLEANYEGPPLDFALDRRFLKDILAAISGPDIAIEVSSPTAALYFRSAGDATSVALVMPQRG